MKLRRAKFTVRFTSDEWRLMLTANELGVCRSTFVMGYLHKAVMKVGRIDSPSIMKRLLPLHNITAYEDDFSRGTVSITVRAESETIDWILQINEPEIRVQEIV